MQQNLAAKIHGWCRNYSSNVHGFSSAWSKLMGDLLGLRKAGTDVAARHVPGDSDCWDAMYVFNDVIL